MTDKILFWLSEELIHFFLANSLQEKLKADFFAIVEGHEGIKKFLEKQDLVKFQNKWYLYDYVKKTDEKPDMVYLKSFEDKYHINIWEIAYSERVFYSEFNKYYEFSSDEILQIIEQHCKLYEHVLQTVNPNYLIINIITRLPTYLMYKLCKANDIEVLTLEYARLGYRSLISNEIDRVDGLENFSIDKTTSHRNFEDLRNYLKKYKPGVGFESRPEKKTPSQKKLSSLLSFLFYPKDEKFKNRYHNYGKSKLNILSKGTTKILSLKRSYREKEISKISKKNIDNNTPYVYYPLHSEPERELLIFAPFFSNQLTVIQNIAKSIPIGYKLYVKDHPIMKEVGWRNVDFYKQIAKLPNVELLDPFVKNEEIIKNSSLVISVAGTPALEAGFYEKPAIVLSNIDYSILPSVFRLEKLDDFPQLIRKALNHKVDSIPLDNYVKLIEDNTCAFDKFAYLKEFNTRFQYEGFLKEVEITKEKINDFLHDFKPIFDNLAEEHLKKLVRHKNKD